MTATVFLDVNILIAGSGSRTGASRVVLGLGEFGLVQLVVTRQVLDEAERNLRLKLPHAVPILAELLLHTKLHVLDNPSRGTFVKWFSIIEEADAPLLEATIQNSVDYFLTLNTKDFTPAVATATGLTIMTPGQFVSHIHHVLGSGLS